MVGSHPRLPIPPQAHLAIIVSTAYRVNGKILRSLTMANGKAGNDENAQHARFVETARKLGCDEDEVAFDEKLKVIARHKPKGEPEPPTKPSSK